MNEWTHTQNCFASIFSTNLKTNFSLLNFYIFDWILPVQKEKRIEEKKNDSGFAYRMKASTNILK